MPVVTSAMITRIANSASEMMPFSSARLSTISSVSPRVFMSVPITIEERQLNPVARAASSAPTSLPTTATSRITSANSHRIGRPSSPMFSRSPVYAKNSGSRSATTKSSRRRVTSSVSPAWRGMARPIRKAPKISAMPISSVV